jgi:hypothetical protein
MTTDGEMLAIDEIFERGMELVVIDAHSKALKD